MLIPCFQFQKLKSLSSKGVTKISRYYFYDNGIRNALINNFNPLNIFSFPCISKGKQHIYPRFGLEFLAKQLFSVLRGCM
ncbi:MAG: hypothetical protein K940chlam6_00060 [Chlamydiae bacterium]|nr:hypothetical protein [Chlamydiota bacterium]